MRTLLVSLLFASIFGCDNNIPSDESKPSGTDTGSSFVSSTDGGSGADGGTDTGGHGIK